MFEKVFQNTNFNMNYTLRPFKIIRTTLSLTFVIFVLTESGTRELWTSTPVPLWVDDGLTRVPSLPTLPPTPTPLFMGTGLKTRGRHGGGGGHVCRKSVVPSDPLHQESLQKFFRLGVQESINNVSILPHIQYVGSVNYTYYFF